MINYSVENSKQVIDNVVGYIISERIRQERKEIQRLEDCKIGRAQIIKEIKDLNHLIWSWIKRLSKNEYK